MLSPQARGPRPRNPDSRPTHPSAASLIARLHPGGSGYTEIPDEQWFKLRIYLFRARQTAALEGRTRFGPFPAERQVRQTPWPHAWGRGALSRQSVGEAPGSSRIHGPRLGASAAGKKGHVLNFFLFRGVFFLQYALFMLVALGLGVLVEGLVLCALQGWPEPAIVVTSIGK